MRLVVDANVLFAAVMKESKTAELFVLDEFELVAPDYILNEFANHRDELLGRTMRSEEDFGRVLAVFTERLRFVTEAEILPFLKNATKISPDKEDIIYFAIALSLGCPLWSNDKQLKQQSAVTVYSTEDIVKLLRF